MLAPRRGLAIAALCALLAGCGGGNGYNGNGYNSNAYYGNGYNNYNGGGGYNTYNGGSYNSYNANGYNGYNTSGIQQRPYYNGNATGYGYPNGGKAAVYGAPAPKTNNNTSGSRYYPHAKCWDCGRS